MSQRTLSLILATMAFTLASLCPSLSSAKDAQWGNWRGPTHAGSALAGDYPTDLTADENLKWKLKLPGPGSSTPIVWGDQIFLTCTIDGQDSAMAFDSRGEELWRESFGKSAEVKHNNATAANPSAATDGRHVVVYFKSGNLACLTTAGQKLWEINLQEKYGKNTLWWDLGSSPVLSGTGVVVPVMQDDQGYLVCLDPESGEEIWKTDRSYKNAKESGQSYTTPSVVTVDGQQQIVTFGADHLTGHNAATGELLWESGGFNPEDKGMWRTIASQSVADGVAVVPYGRADFVSGVRLGGSGDVTDSNLLWQHEGFGSDVPTPAIVDNKAYILGDKGVVTCVAVRSGEVQWTGKLPRSRHKYFASPVVAGGHLYVAREDGTAIVAKLDESLSVVSEFETEETLVATPVLQDGRLLIRTREHLYCFGN